MDNSIQWFEETLRLEDLRPFEDNPRTITKEQFAKLKASLIEFGQFRPLLATHDKRLAGGHQRLQIMKELEWVEARVSRPVVPISDEQYLKLVVIDNHNNGIFDMDMMANMFDLEELRGFGLHEVNNIAPFAGEDESEGKRKVCCPQCGNTFPVKGNAAQ